jgi:hypothetical protein
MQTSVEIIKGHPPGSDKSSESTTGDHASSAWQNVSNAVDHPGAVSTMATDSVQASGGGKGIIEKWTAP